MTGVSIVTNGAGVKTGFFIDVNTLRQHSVSGQMVTQYISSLEDIEDMIDVELARYDEADSWETVKQQLKSEHKLSANV
ncbi:hypothetical protein FACS189452_02990 [Bacteroidia bacterium]|nr:hypothetical protein FACS189452_02990 [Bacteroidia bacterium]GHT82172.1 hypothetical protein FACS189467_7180 [Bacteroidia bacterium]